MRKGYAYLRRGMPIVSAKFSWGYVYLGATLIRNSRATNIMNNLVSSSRKGCTKVKMREKSM